MESNLALVDAADKADDAAQLPAQILTIEPETYVAAVYEGFQKDLQHALARVAAGVSYDISTTAGMKDAVAWRARFRAIRIEADKARKERKAPILEIGRLLDSKYKEIAEAVEPHEEKFDADIKAEEKRKAEEREAAAKAEADRIAGIQTKIAGISQRAVNVALNSRTAEMVLIEIAALDGMEIGTDEFQEFAEAAAYARRAALESMGKKLAQLQEAEAEAAEIAREREELRQLRAERAARREAEAKAQAEAEAAAQAEADRLAAQAKQEEAVQPVPLTEEPVQLSVPAVDVDLKTATAIETMLATRTVFVTIRIHDEHAANWIYDQRDSGEIVNGISIEAIE